MIFSILCTSLGLALLYAGLSKIRTFKQFRVVVGNFDFVPESIIGVLSLSIVVVECLLGLALLFGVSVHSTLVAVLCTNGTLATVTLLAKNSTGSSVCFCFGADGVLANSWKSVIRTVLLMGGNLISLLIWYTTPHTRVPPLSIENVLIALVLILILAWLSDVPDLVTTKRPFKEWNPRALSSKLSQF